MQIISTETRESFLSLKKKRLLKKPTSGELSDAEKAIAAFIKAVNDQNLATVADAERKIDQIETWPVSYASWPQVEQALNSSKDALGAYQAFLIFDDKTRLPEIYKKLASKNKTFLDRLGNLQAASLPTLMSVTLNLFSKCIRSRKVYLIFWLRTQIY